MYDGALDHVGESGQSAYLPSCRYCGVVFPSPAAVRDHKKTRVDEEPDGDSRVHLCCTICDLDFKTHGGLDHHRRQVRMSPTPHQSIVADWFLSSSTP